MIHKLAIIILLSFSGVSAEAGLLDFLIGSDTHKCAGELTTDDAAYIIWQATGWKVIAVGTESNLCFVIVESHDRKEINRYWVDHNADIVSPPKNGQKRDTEKS